MGTLLDLEIVCTDSVYDYFESWDGISAYDDCYYDDNEYFVTIHRVTMLDVILFPELESCLEFNLWRDNDGNLESDWIDSDCPMYVFIGL